MMFILVALGRVSHQPKACVCDYACVCVRLTMHMWSGGVTASKSSKKQHSFVIDSSPLKVCKVFRTFYIVGLCLNGALPDPGITPAASAIFGKWSPGGTRTDFG